jgi:hypothetical protein
MEYKAVIINYEVSPLKKQNAEQNYNQSHDKQNNRRASDTYQQIEGNFYSSYYDQEDSYRFFVVHFHSCSP